MVCIISGLEPFGFEKFDIKLNDMNYGFLVGWTTFLPTVHLFT